MLRAQGPLPMDRAVRYFEQALRGIEHMHRHGVVHRDLKPSNIFVTTDEQVKMMDFGVARIIDQHDTAQNGTMVGTLLYISPEQINGRETDFRSDVYTLGVSLFEAITGRLPFERRSDYGLMHAHVQEQPPRPNLYQRRVPPALEWVILKAIEKDPTRRFQSATEFRAALLRIGVLERRDREGDSTGLRHLLPDTSQLRQEFKRYRLSPRSRLFGGLAFDIALVVLAAGLTFSLLGLPPFKNNGSTNAAPAAVRPAARTTPRPAVRNVAARPAPAQAPSTNTPAPKPAAVQYQQLRQAWGD
jgi:serine/threonine-protein kinase